MTINNLIYDMHPSSTLNWLISKGIIFEVHPFLYRNGLLLVYKTLQTKSHVASEGDMRWDLIKSVLGKPNATYSSCSVYFFPQTPETVAEREAIDFELETV